VRCGSLATYHRRGSIAVEISTVKCQVWWGLQVMENQQLTLISTLQILQSIVLFFGVATGTCVCVAGVIAGRLTVGDTVLFLALMGQLIAPLNSWASYYRQAGFPSLCIVSSVECLDRVVSQ
jgi:ABC-type transport system involved in Fe-S cluster assembly fused permease/ATPase subunit